MTVQRTAAGKRGKVLIINSDPEITGILEVNLVHANLEVISVQNDTEALEKIHRDKSDIIILDQDLLDVEGSETSRRLKELSANIPVILIGSESQQRNLAGSDKNTISYVNKPFDPGEVVALVQRNLAFKRGTPDRLPVQTRVNTTATRVRGKEIIPSAFVPEIFRGKPQNVDSLQVAMDVNRKDVREALKNIQRIISSFVKTVPPALKDSFDRLAGDVQEMAVLGNRSFYLATDLKNRLEMQQDRLLKQDSDRLATLEAIITICRNLARSVQAQHLFDLESGQRVAKYALAIAEELKLPDLDRQVLYRACLLKDLALAFVRPRTIECAASIGSDAASFLKEKLRHIWKLLTTVPFLSSACNLLLYKDEKYDGTGGSFGLKGENIPLEARVLAVADAFHSLTSARSPRGQMATELAAQEVNKESGLSFDPNVVSTLLILLKRKEI
jgi:response regulator RpfG family c-di-GMP phosphodiesterase